jgi:peptidoglycan/LPS O-acetylase OafA/YrhL
MAKRYYRPELDALRFFAFACVFCDHLPIKALWFRPMRESGAFGLCIFFMLSAYLIITILLREKDTTGTVNWKNFAIRRVLRIWPPYFAILFLVFGLGHYWPAAHISNHAVITFSLLLGNVYILREGWIVGPITPLWSISVEEQFYLAVPMIARFTGRRSMAGIFIAAIVFAYIVLLWLGGKGAIPTTGVWVNSFVQFQFFAAGGLIALWLHEDKLTLSPLTRCCLAISGLGLWHLATTQFHLRSPLPSNSRQLICGYLLVLLGTTMIFLSVVDIESHIPQPLVYLGKTSYGLYLYHELFIYLIFESAGRWPRMHYFQLHRGTSIALIFGLTVATAALSYHFFERPILKFKERFETIRTRPA